MLKRLTISAAALCFIAALAVASPKDKDQKWSGVIVDNMCGAKDAVAGKAECTKKCASEHGAKLALYDDASKSVYVLDPQDKATGHEGHHVVVKGTLDGDTIHVTSLKMEQASAPGSNY
jgi:hypothetical protein